MLLKTSLSVSILILVVVITRTFAIHKLPKKTFLILWSVALSRLLIPISIPSQFSIFSFMNRVKVMIQEANPPVNLPYMGAVAYEGGITNELYAPVIGGTAVTNTSIINIDPINVVWLAGLAICALIFLGTHLRFLVEYNSALPVDDTFVNFWLMKHSIKRTIQIRQSDKIIAPLTYGIWKPKILLPKTMDWKNETMLQYVLTHEYIHVKRFDILLKWLLAAALCIHWFNPLVWVMYILANRDIEISCDEAVVKTLGNTNKSTYALALIELEEKKNGLIPLFVNFSKNAIEERIVAIMKIKKTTVVSLLIAFVLVAGSIIAFATSAKEDEDLGLLKKAIGDDVYKYAENINKISDKTARAETDEYTIYIDSTIFTDKNVYVLIGAEGELPDNLDISGRIALAQSDQDLYGLNGEIKETESVNGVRYFLYSAVIGSIGEVKDKDPMLVLASGGEDEILKRQSLLDCEGEKLELRLNLGNSEYILKTSVSDVSSNALIFYPDRQNYDGDYYSKVILTPWEVKFSGHSEKAYSSYEELDDQLDIMLTITLSDGKRINMSHDSRGSIMDEGYKFGMSRGADMDSGEFYHWWNLRGWELDLSQVQEIILDGKTYRVER